MPCSGPYELMIYSAPLLYTMMFPTANGTAATTGLNQYTPTVAGLAEPEEAD